MTKVRKQKRKKVYKYNVNRKKQKNKMRRRPKVLCEHLKKEWDNSKAPKQNMLEMGLSIDPNETLKLPPNRPLNMEIEEETPKPQIADKTYVIKNMELEAKAPRKKNFRLPNSQVLWLTKLLDKYGEDYKAMVKDRKLNCFQETWKQLRHKINRFKSVPEQYGEYLKKKEAENLQIESSGSVNDKTKQRKSAFSSSGAYIGKPNIKASFVPPLMNVLLSYFLELFKSVLRMLSYFY